MALDLTLLPTAPLSIPSPGQGVWHLGPIPIRAYALCIIAGIVVAVWLGERRWLARGGLKGQVSDLALWAVPFGLVGARLYHVATDWEKYFPGNPWGALQIWNGGLGIWGAIAGGFVGAVIGARRLGLRIRPLADALAPGLLLAQALGRWGNYFNQELFGRPTTLPWGLEIAPDKRPPGYAEYATFHPTFLYECLWCLAACAVLIWADKRFKLGYGRVFALYVMLYTAGRAWIENMRIDDVQLHNVFGLRFNVWMSLLMFVLALAYFLRSRRQHPGREDGVLLSGAGDDGAVEEPDDEPGTATDAAGDDEDATTTVSTS